MKNYDDMSFKELHRLCEERGGFKTDHPPSKYDNWTFDELYAECKRRGLL